MSKIIHLGVKYKKLTKSSNPLVDDILYKLPQSEDGDIEPLKLTVTHWGADNHGKDDHYLIEVIEEYPTSFINLMKEKYKTKSRKKKKDLEDMLKPRRVFLPLDTLFKKVDL